MDHFKENLALLQQYYHMSLEEFSSYLGYPKKVVSSWLNGSGAPTRSEFRIVSTCLLLTESDLKTRNFKKEIYEILNGEGEILDKVTMSNTLDTFAFFISCKRFDMVEKFRKDDKAATRELLSLLQTDISSCDDKLSLFRKMWCLIYIIAKNYIEQKGYKGNVKLNKDMRMLYSIYPEQFFVQQFWVNAADFICCYKGYDFEDTPSFDVEKRLDAFNELYLQEYPDEYTHDVTLHLPV